LGNHKSLLFGNPERPEREKHPSAHNYYLDLAYNFGIISLIPILIFLARTFKKIYELQTQIYKNQSLAGLIFVVLFLLLVDNSLKVGMRQPYPGIITFFLWGLLLSRLQRYDGVRTAENS
jgi:O-antigen ligase